MRQILRRNVSFFTWVMAVALLPVQAKAFESPCRRCGWKAAETPTTVRVSTSTELLQALSKVSPQTTILLADGTYTLDRSFDISTPDIVLRSASGQRERVILRGSGMDEQQIGSALSISAPRVTIADLSIGMVKFHGIQVRGEREADDVQIHNVRVVDTGQQLIKGSMSEQGRGPHSGQLACSLLEYSTSAPSDYTNGIDVLGGRGWTVRGNTFRRVRGPQEGGWKSGPTILFWGGSSNTTIEGNLILDCYRGIALGLNPRQTDPPDDHQGGLISRNVVCNLGGWSDEPIEVNACPDARVEHNTILVEGSVPWSIKLRFPNTTATVVNNLSNHEISVQGGAKAEQAGNITNAVPEWFVDPRAGNLHLTHRGLPPIGAAVRLDPSNASADRNDVGAFRFVESAPSSPGNRDPLR